MNRAKTHLDAKTHLGIDAELCGTPMEVGDGFSRVELTPGPRTASDEHGLVHGGFTFGLADYAAMLAVNHPNVVLAAAEVRFLRPVRTGERLVAEARIEGAAADTGPGGDDKPWVEVTVSRDDEPVFSGRFRCYVPRRHVLSVE